VSDVIGNPTLRAEFDSRALLQGARDGTARLKTTFEQSNRTIEAAQRNATKRIQGLVSQINAERPRRQMFELGQAVQHMGGLAQLSEGQVSRLRKEVERLTAAGAKAPKSLAGLTKTGAGPSLGAAFQSLTTGGGISGALAAIGPAGVAAAGAVGAVSLAVSGAVSGISALAGQAERWTNLAKATGLGAQDVQRLGKMFEDAGIPAETLSGAMRELQNEIAGGGKQVGKFGISIADLKGQAPIDQLREMAARVEAIDDPTDRAAARSAAFGRSAQDLAAVLPEVATGADKMFSALGDEALAKLSRTDAALDGFSRTAKEFKEGFLLGITPDFGGVTDDRGLPLIRSRLNTKGVFPDFRSTPDPSPLSLGEETPEQAAAKVAYQAQIRELEAATAKAKQEKEARQKLIDGLLAEVRQRDAIALKRFQPATQISSTLLGRRTFANEMVGGQNFGAITGVPTKEESEENQKALEEATAKADEETQRLIGTFGTLSNQLTNLSDKVGGFTGLLLSAASSLSSGVGGVLSGITGFKQAGKLGGLEGLLGKVSSSFGVVGSVVGAVGGLVSGIKGFFGRGKTKKEVEEASRILGEKVTEEELKSLKQQAEQEGKDWRQYLKERKAADDKARAVEARQKLEQGLGTARGGAEALIERLAKGGLSEGLTTALQTLIGKVGDALLRNGLGILDPQLQKSEAFRGAQDTAAEVAQVIAGMREAGLIDQGLLAAGGAAAGDLQRQATEAALAEGKSPEEAAKAGIAAVAPLLREQLNASIQSGKELDATTKQLLEEAKANGIEILADPAIESLDVQRDQLGVLKEIARRTGGGGGDGAIPAARGLGPVKMPNMGGGLGPLIQTHAGELALILPAHMARRGGIIHAARGVYDDDDGTWGGRDVGGGGDTGGGETETSTSTEVLIEQFEAAVERVMRRAQAAQPIAAIENPVSIQIVDESVVKTVEGQRAFGRHVVAEVERALDQNSRGLEARIERIAQRAVR
jgi:hypothetical protein